MMERLATFLFGEPEDIDGGPGCPVYLRRWWMKDLGDGRRVYLHKFLTDDWSRDMHDHPKRFVSIGLWGSYVEETPEGERLFRAPWFRSFQPEHVHRIRLVGLRPCWTLVIIGETVRDWGFWTSAGWVQWERYLRDRTGPC